MMIHAYLQIYLNSAQGMLGDAFDYAINTCGISGDEFIKMFSVSSVSGRIENGEPGYVAGKSGIEIVQEIIEETKGRNTDTAADERFGRSKEYWIGWALAYYQWYSGRRFHDIFKVLSFEDLQKMYYTLHESDLSKFADIVDSKMKEYFKDINLKRIRIVYGLTQAQLADRSGVSLRSIQMYEQRNKNINKASAETIYRLSRTLGCTMEDLVERNT